MISQTAEYALRAVVWLAGRPEGEVHSTSRIAAGTGVPPGYLAKVLQALGRASLVRSQSGRRGGVLLARSASSMTLLDVVRAVDPDRRIRSCPLGHADHRELCPLHARLDEAVARADAVLARTSIAEMGAGPDHPLCVSRDVVIGPGGPPPH